MKEHKTSSAYLALLRQNAEIQLNKAHPDKPLTHPEFEMLKLLHELEVHQLELEMQNEELRQALTDAEDAIKLYDFAPTGYYTFSRNGDILNLNLYGARLLGKYREQLQNSRFGLFVARDSLPVFNLFLDNAFNSNTTEACDIAMETTGAIPIYLHLTGITVQNREHCLVTATDITALKQTEKSLTAQALRNQILLQTASDGLHVLDVNGQIVEVNTAFCDMLGYTREELLQLTVADWDIQWDGEELLAKISELMKQPAVFATCHRRKDGTLLDVEINSMGIVLEGVNYLHVSAHDITERKIAETARQETHDRFSKIASRVPGVVYQYRLRPDGSSCFPYANDAIIDIYGISPDELITDASRVFEIIHPDDRAGVVASIQASARDLTPWQHEYRVKLANGITRSLYGNAVPERSDDGSVLWHGFISDVSARKLMEETLRDEHWRMENIIEGTHVGTWEWNIQTGEAVFNSIWAEMIGYSLEELAPLSITTWASLSHPADLALSKELLEKHFAGELPYYDCENRIKHKNGHWVWIHDRGRVITRTEDGKPLMMFGTHTDITERKQAQEKLLDNNKKHRALIENISDVIYTIDTSGKFTYISPVIEKVIGIKPADILGRNFSEFIHPDDLPRLMESLAQTMQGEGSPFEFRVFMGEQVKYVRTSSQLLYSGGVLSGLNGIMTDITGRKLSEDLLQQTRQNYETFFNTIDDFLFVLDGQGNIIHTNATVTRRLGYTEEDLAGQSVLTVHPPERREEAGRIVGEMLSGTAEFCPVPLVTKTGVQIPVETRVKPGTWNGKPVIFGVTKDISRIQLSEEKFSKVFYLNPSACGLSNLDDHKYVEVNEAFYTLFGFEKDEVIGKTAIDLGIFTQENRRDILSKSGNQSKIINQEARLRTKNGDIRHVLLSAENIKVQDREYRFTVVNDITRLKEAEEALHESNQKWEAIISASPDGIGMIALDGTIQLMSDKVANMYGYSLDQRNGMNGSSIFDFIDPSCHKSLTDNIHKLIEGKSDHSIKEYLAVRKDNSRFPIDVNSTILFDTDGRPESILFIERDITASKRIQEALQESELRYRTLFTTSPSGIIVVDENGTILEANETFSKTTLYPHDELIGMDVRKLTPSKGTLMVAKNIQRILSGEIVEQEVESLRKDGTGCIFMLREIAVTLPDGRNGILSVSNDVTERKMAEAALQENELRLQSLARILQLNTNSIQELLDFTLEEAIQLTSSKLGYIYFYNEQSQEFTLYSWSKDVMKECSIQEPKCIYSLAETGIWGEAVRQRKPILINDFHAQNYLKKGYPEGHARLDNFLTVPVLVNNDIVAVIGVANKESDYQDTDILHLTLLMDSTWKAFQKKDTDELVKKQNTDLLKLIAEKDKFFSIIAHDLRSPFNGFLGLTEVMSEKLPQMTLSEIQILASEMKKSAGNLYNLLGNLLDWSRMQRGLTTFTPVSFLLQEGIMENMVLLLETSVKKNISVTYSLDENMVVSADKNMFDGIIRNLVTNAIKFTSSGGAIHIAANATAGDMIEVSIQDSGIGIDEKRKDALFRLDVNTSRAGTDGESSTGLGLIICKDFIEIHGGELKVESEEGKGSTFRFTISGHITNADPSSENHHPAVAEARPIKKLKILIAEDDETSQMLLAISLSPISSKIVKVRNGSDAVQACRNDSDIDLIMMDMQMPKMDGFEATRQIRQFNKEVIIIAQTAYSTNGDREKTIEAGCTDYISKPIQHDKLLAIIKKYL